MSRTHTVTFLNHIQNSEKDMKRHAVYQFLEKYTNLMYRPRPIQHWKFVKHTREDVRLTFSVLFVSSSSLWTFRAYVSFIFTYFVFRAFCTSFSCGVLESPSPAINCRSFSLLLLDAVVIEYCNVMGVCQHSVQNTVHILYNAGNHTLL